MSFYKQLQSRIEDQVNSRNESYRNRLMGWRRAETSVFRLERPTNLTRARRLGYKAKQGYIIVLCRVPKGNRHKSRPTSGRKPSKMGVKKYSAKKSKRQIAEERVAKRYPNMAVLNSYLSGDDSIHEYYEVILKA